MDKLVSINEDDLEYVKRTAKEDGIAQKKVIERCVTYCRKNVKTIKIETTLGGDKVDLSEMQE
jgi:hypothetical protein|tara:strand:+ start:1133 stop:1321 length:189 start_codon:yes stop_codon:yes gene_type:complete